MSIDLAPLRRAITRKNLMQVWRNDLHHTDSAHRAKEKALQARHDYTRMMRSKSNDGSDQYQHWAISKALDLPCKPNRKPNRVGWNVKASLRRTNRGLN